MTTNGKLTGRVALITGASRGLGRAMALAFAREGADLVLCARGEDELKQVAAEARERGSNVLTVAADMALTRDVERLVVLALERFDRVDILVNNASQLGPTPLPYLIDYPPHVFSDVMKVNVMAPFHLIWSLLGGMIQRRDGVIINVSSDVAVNGYPGWGAYSVSKAALDGLTRTWATELTGTGVKIYAVDPTDMNTDMHRAAVPEDDPASLADPADIAEAFVALATGVVDPALGRLEATQLLKHAEPAGA
ncbi:MAG TPA: SDR family oxidoreductase [Candidatus Solibacter sp.]|jgi:NAD(P)-dependent dehydrogenase (short-subunit alcohol dehydrogenase family)|nr:SDR family oxidoreductase [Candidatus Solibacter sp.]